MNLTVNKIENKIVGVVNNKKYSINFDLDIFKKLNILLVEYDKAENIDSVKAIVEKAEELVKINDSLVDIHKFLSFDKHSNSLYLKSSKKTSSYRVPDVLSEIIINSISDNRKCDYLIKFWCRLLMNQSATYDDLVSFCEWLNYFEYYTEDLTGQYKKKITKSVKITESGLILLACNGLTKTQIIKRNESSGYISSHGLNLNAIYPELFDFSKGVSKYCEKINYEYGKAASLYSSIILSDFELNDNNINKCIDSSKFWINSNSRARLRDTFIIDDQKYYLIRDRRSDYVLNIIKRKNEVLGDVKTEILGNDI